MVNYSISTTRNFPWSDDTSKAVYYHIIQLIIFISNIIRNSTFQNRNNLLLLLLLTGVYSSSIIVFSWGNCFPIVFVWLLGCEHYTSQDNTTGKLFPREKTIICLGHKRKKTHCTEIETKLVGIDIAKPHHVNSKCLIDYSAVYSKGGKSCQNI